MEIQLAVGDGNFKPVACLEEGTFQVPEGKSPLYKYKGQFHVFQNKQGQLLIQTEGVFEEGKDYEFKIS